MSHFTLTNSALEAIHRNNISRDMVFNAISNAEKTFPGKQPGTTVFVKSLQNGSLSVVGKRSGSEVVIITCWFKSNTSRNVRQIDPRYKNASFWKRVWLDLITTFGM